MKERLKFDLGEIAQTRAVVQASELYGPQEAIREYLTNAIDAVKDAKQKAYRGTAGIVTLNHSMSGRTIRIDDDAAGMSEKTLRELPVRVWDSAKRGGYVQAGEKGIGLLAFGSVGDSVSIISRAQGEQGYNHLRFEKDSEGGEQVIVPTFERLSDRDLEQFYGNGFEHGTRVVVAVNPVHLRGRLAPRTLERFIQSTYAPLLMRGNPALWLDEEGKPTKRLEMPSYKGELLIDKTIPFVAGTRASPVEGKAHVYLVLDSESDRGAIALHERDVRVWDAIAGHEEQLEGMKLWTSPHVSGFVNTTGLVLTQDRDDVVRENRGYSNFLESVIRDVESQLGGTIEARSGAFREAAEQRVVKQAYDLVSRAYSESGDPLNKQVRIISRDHNPHPNPSSNGTHHGNNGQGRGGSGGPSRKRTCPQIPIKVRDFDTDNDHLRVRLDEMLEAPVIAVNAAHPAYREAMGTGVGAHTNYLTGCIAYGIASVEMREALEKQGKFTELSPVDIAHEIHARAQNITDSIRGRGGKR